jgi:hypothetical protein
MVNDERIVLMAQDETSVYYNDDGMVIIKQTTPMDDVDDVIIIEPENVDRIIAALANAKVEVLEYRAAAIAGDA